MNQKPSQSEDVNTTNNLLFQKNPLYSKNDLFPEQGWTSSVLGYQKEAKEWAYCVNKNRDLLGHPYQWVIHLNHNEVLDPQVIRDIWDRSKRKLHRHGLNSLWVREVNSLNKMHYHIIEKGPISKSQLADAFERSMPPRSKHPWRKRIETIRKQEVIGEYVFKAKLWGYNPFVLHPVSHADKYRFKRLLFKPRLGLRKVGTIGQFWALGWSKELIWDQCIEQERKISEGITQHRLDHLVEHVHQLLSPSYNLGTIRRLIEQQKFDPIITRWAESLASVQKRKH